MQTERLYSWRMTEAGKPLTLSEHPLPTPSAGEVLLEVKACGLCHTDFGFLYGGVCPNAPLPLTLGHEILGRAVVAGDGVEDFLGGTFVVPAVLPCGDCELCRSGRGNVCRRQRMPGNDFDGGFASHFLTPAKFLCPVPPDADRGDHKIRRMGKTGSKIEHFSVVADAVGTAYQAVLRSGAGDGDLVIVIGAGGVGTFAAQTARHLGARVIAIDIHRDRLEGLEDWLDLGLDASAMTTGEIKQAVGLFERQSDMPSTQRKIIECSGTAAGQQTAWSLLRHNATLVVIGYTRDKLSLRLSNLMAFDAQVIGNWGCLPEHFPAILDLVDRGAIELEPFVECHPMSRLNDLLAEEHHRRRPILLPDFENSP